MNEEKPFTYPAESICRDHPRDTFNLAKKQVLTLIGYSGMGYADPEGLKERFKTDLGEFPADEWIVNIGATPYGIGELYEVASSLGYETVGIVSKRSRKKSNYHPDCQMVFVVEDETWGGELEDGSLSPTSRTILDCSDQILGYGGGRVGRAELCAAIREDLPVLFFPVKPGKSKGR